MDVELTERLQRKEVLPSEEVRANDAASEFVVPSEELNSFIIRVRPLYSEQRILLYCSFERKCHILIFTSIWQRSDTS
jgi:HTH-type transcriptional regulator/antitoxin HigA